MSKSVEPLGKTFGSFCYNLIMKMLTSTKDDNKYTAEMLANVDKAYGISVLKIGRVYRVKNLRNDEDIEYHFKSKHMAFPVAKAWANRLGCQAYYLNERHVL